MLGVVAVGIFCKIFSPIKTGNTFPRALELQD